MEYGPTVTDTDGNFGLENETSGLYTWIHTRST